MTLKLNDDTEARKLEEELLAWQTWVGEENIDASEVAAVKAIADRLDLVRERCSEIGMATLLAEVRDVPPAVVCSALDELAEAVSRTIAVLRGGSRTER